MSGEERMKNDNGTKQAKKRGGRGRGGVNKTIRLDWNDLN